jgi:hypothetical protein
LRHADRIDVGLDRLGDGPEAELRPGGGVDLYSQVVPVISAAPSAILTSLSKVSLADAMSASRTNHQICP